ncbi:MarR family winged helix-turn-helix transcriptional regulator [Luedemannella helvata]|uniref:HTH marR-type domain-containing protein n=1 Tax=Luedemannella helvata TaxID=349315 RepID=A0ABN2KBF9_9ACTN
MTETGILARMEGSEERGREPCAARYGPISHVVFRIAKCHRALAGALLRDVGLHPGQELLMMFLWDSGPQRQADLAAEFNTDSASMTRTVQRLERAGYVRRVPDPEDGRATRVEPTPASLVLREKVERLWADLEAWTVGDMSGADRVAVLAALQRIEDNLNAAPCRRSADQQVEPDRQQHGQH